MSKLFDSRLADVIRKPVITEKATNALDLNQYTFEVDHRAAKPQIKSSYILMICCCEPSPNAFLRSVMIMMIVIFNYCTHLSTPMYLCFYNLLYLLV